LSGLTLTKKCSKSNFFVISALEFSNAEFGLNTYLFYKTDALYYVLDSIKVIKYRADSICHI